MKTPKLLSIAALCLALTAGSSIGAAKPHNSHEPGAGDARVKSSAARGPLALVIGNARYERSPLANPANDAKAMVRVLRARGYEVVLLEDAASAAMREALHDFAGRLGDGRDGLLYFAGHGARLGGRQFLIPADVDPASEAEVGAAALSLETVMKALARPGARGRNLVIIDACANFLTPNAGDATAAVLDGTDLADNSLLALATRPGAMAEDGLGAHGVYAGALLEALAVPSRTLTAALDRAARHVSSWTAGRQVPMTISVLNGVQVVDTPKVSGQGYAVMAQSQPRGVRSSRESQAAELAFWESIKGSTNPAEYEAYLQTFPDGVFAPLAKARIKLYSKTAPAPSAPKAAEPAPKPAPEPAPAPVKKAEPAAPVIDRVEGDFIARTAANVRAQPSTASKTLGKIARGARVEVLGQVRDGNWYQVRTDRGRTGFVAASLLLKMTAPAKKQQAVVVQPKAPKVETPVQPAVGQFPKAAGETFRDCKNCPEMVLVPAGSFQMGANDGDAAERPVHRVTIGKSFAIGRFEVTVGEWVECVNAGACSYQPKVGPDADRVAVRNVSWDDIQIYIRWLSNKTGRQYRLPSEAEWEYAARGGTQTKYWWGNAIAGENANCKNCGGPWSRKAPAYIGTYDANPLGLHDVSGGVAEWVADCWNATHQGASSNGAVRGENRCSQRVLRGGSWRNDATYLRSASRFFYDASVRYLTNGFRVAAEVK